MMATPSYEDKILTIPTSYYADETNGLTMAATTTIMLPTLAGGMTATIPPSSVSGTDVPGYTTRLPNGVIAGIVVGSVVGLVSILFCVLLAFGFRIRRSKAQPPPTSRSAPSTGSHLQIPQPWDAEHPWRKERLHGMPSPAPDDDGIALSGLTESTRSSRLVAELEGDSVHPERADSIMDDSCGIQIYWQDTGGGSGSGSRGSL